MVTRQLQTWINCIVSSIVTLFLATAPHLVSSKLTSARSFVLVLFPTGHQRTNHRKHVIPDNPHVRNVQKVRRRSKATVIEVLKPSST